MLVSRHHETADEHGNPSSSPAREAGVLACQPFAGLLLLRKQLGLPLGIDLGLSPILAVAGPVIEEGLDLRSVNPALA